MALNLDRRPQVGIGYRLELNGWTRTNLGSIDVLEVVLDHYINGNPRQRDLIQSLVGDVPLTSHGVGLSLGTDQPPDPTYLERITDALECLKMPYYSEHLAFTGVPGLELGNLLPLPRTEEVAERVIDNIRVVQSFLSVPLLLENITYYFDYPDSDFADFEFLRLVCRETGAGVLLDVENLYANAVNGFTDPIEFVDAIPPEMVGAVHTAGGRMIGDVFVDTHDQPIPNPVMGVLDHVLARCSPAAVIVERDHRLHEVGEIAHDLKRVGKCVERHSWRWKEADDIIAGTPKKSAQLSDRPVAF